MSRRHPDRHVISPPPDGPRVWRPGDPISGISASPPPPAPSIEQLVPFLLSRGEKSTLEVGWTGAGQIMLTSACGPIKIPHLIGPEQWQPLCDALQKAMEEAMKARESAAAEHTQEPGLPAIPAGTEDLLAESEAAVSEPTIVGWPDNPELLPAEACTGA